MALAQWNAYDCCYGIASESDMDSSSYVSYAGDNIVALLGYNAAAPSTLWNGTTNTLSSMESNQNSKVWIMLYSNLYSPNHYDTAYFVTSVVKLSSGGYKINYSRIAKITTNGTYARGQYLYQINAEEGTYPTNGRYSDNRWYVFQRVLNTAPTISGNANEDLGNKNTPFVITYSVNDVDGTNVLNIVEKLNGVQINSISNAPRNTNFTINITKEILDSLPLNQQSTILISVTDGSATTYKTITFKRTNNGPVISNTDKDLGQVTRESVGEKYTCHDVEGNTFTIVEKINDIELKNTVGVDGTEYTISIPEATWFKLPNGVHKYTITATDSLGSSNTRIFTFTKKETIIESTGLAKIFETDAAATKILLTPSWSGIENATVKIEVCNNAHDVAPTWEDATSQVLINKAYMFTNKVKTATKWGIDVRFKITRKDGTTGNVDFYGLGGAFE